MDHQTCIIKEWATTSDLKEDTMTTMMTITTTMVGQCILQEADIMLRDLTEEMACLLVEAQGSDLNLMEDRVSQKCVVEGLP